MALAPRHRTAWLTPPANGFPVVLYHGILAPDAAPPTAGRKFWLPRPLFLGHLAAIAAQPRRPQRLASPRLYAAGAVNQCMVIAFDDGLASDYSVALPALLQFGMVAEFFLNPARIGAAGYLTWTQVRALAAAGMSIQSHGWDHEDHTALADLDLRARLIRAKHTLEQATGQPVDFFAAPYGYTDRRLFRAARHAGYRAVCTSTNLWATAAGLTARNEVPRIGLTAADSPVALAAIVGGSPGAFCRRVLRHRLLAAAGHARYRFLPPPPSASPRELAA